MKTTCSTCKSMFSADPKVKKHRGFLEITYFECPDCGETFIAFCTDNEVRERLAKTQRLRKRVFDKKLSAQHRGKARRKLLKMAKENRRTMRQKLDEYKREIAEAFSQT